MQIKKARFLTSMKSTVDYPADDLPEIAICGRSNVGKSSLINLLTGNYKIAKTSAVPGKTRLVNFFVINEQFLIVDLPGYGYAGVSKSEKNSWGEMVEGYLGITKNLRALLILIDIRRIPSDDDLSLFKWAAHFGFHVIIVATKADKVAKTQRPHLISSIKEKTGGVGYPVIAVSSLKKFGQQELLDEIEKVLL
jgi:GTP-binding protein